MYNIASADIIMEEPSLSNLKISRLRKVDIPALFKISRAARWPHTKQDWLDTMRFGRVFGHRDGETILSCVSITEYSPQFAALSMILVRQKLLGKGLASALLQEVQRHNPPTRSLGVIASSRKAMKIYESYGFRDTGEQIVSLLHPEGMDNRIWKQLDPHLVVNTAP
jgi:GNAT superfamily N-acetyltransferase